MAAILPDVIDKVVLGEVLTFLFLKEWSPSLSVISLQLKAFGKSLLFANTSKSDSCSSSSWSF